MTGSKSHQSRFAPSRFVRRPIRGFAGALALTLALALTSALGLAGCGNYSNEDLEFMSAIPQRDDMAIEVPRRGNLILANTAEGWKTTLELTRGFNGAADAFLSLIEKIRSHYPTSRNANERIWGPFPHDENPGWSVEFRMLKRFEVEPPRFEYQLVLIPPAGVVLPSGHPVTQIIGGSFEASGGVRIGKGHLAVTFDEARLAGVLFPKIKGLRELIVDYETGEWPRSAKMSILSDTDAAPATYDYLRAQNGDGTMTFGNVNNVVEVGPALENFMLKSRWLGTGPGRADITVTGGDTPGGLATTLECWDETFEQRYLTSSWDGAMTGDMASCIP